MKSRYLRVGRLAACAFVSVVLLGGCSFLEAFYFGGVFFGMDPRIQPIFEMPEDAGRVVVVTNADIGTQIDIGPIDDELNRVITRNLHEGFQKERRFRDIKVIADSKVAKWKDEHFDWRQMEPGEIGRALGADYVISVDLEDISMFQDGAHRMLYQGRADITVSVIKILEDSTEIAFGPNTQYCEFPKGRPIPVGDINTKRFRRFFLARLAERVIWHFVPHEGIDAIESDPF